MFSHPIANDTVTKKRRRKRRWCIAGVFCQRVIKQRSKPKLAICQFISFNKYILVITHLLCVCVIFIIYFRLLDIYMDGWITIYRWMDYNKDSAYKERERERGRRDA